MQAFISYEGSLKSKLRPRHWTRQVNVVNRPQFHGIYFKYRSACPLARDSKRARRVLKLSPFLLTHS